jgi:hypothetical protein
MPKSSIYEIPDTRYEIRDCLGNFNSEIQAAKAYDQTAKKYHGEFAALNLPKSK